MVKWVHFPSLLAYQILAEEIDNGGYLLKAMKIFWRISCESLYLVGSMALRKVDFPLLAGWRMEHLHLSSHYLYASFLLFCSIVPTTSAFIGFSWQLLIKSQVLWGFKSLHLICQKLLSFLYIFGTSWSCWCYFCCRDRRKESALRL